MNERASKKEKNAVVFREGLQSKACEFFFPGRDGIIKPDELEELEQDISKDYIRKKQTNFFIDLSTIEKFDTSLIDLVGHLGMRYKDLQVYLLDPSTEVLKTLKKVYQDGTYEHLIITSDNP